MMDKNRLEQALSELPLYIYSDIDPNSLEFAQRVRYICERCAYLDGLPCRLPGKMHPCVESHGINILPTLETLGVPFQYGENVVSWFSLLFYND